VGFTQREVIGLALFQPIGRSIVRRQPGREHGEQALRLGLLGRSLPREPCDRRGCRPAACAKLVLGKLDQRGRDGGAAGYCWLKSPQLGIERLAEKRRKARHRPETQAQEMRQGRARQGAEIGRRGFRDRGPEIAAAKLLILPMPHIPVLQEALERRVGRHAAMQLMERTLAQQGYALRARQIDGAVIGVEVQKAAARHVEALVPATQFLPHRAAQGDEARFAKRPKPAMHGRLIEGRDLEQPVAVLRPIDSVQQGIFLGLVVAGGDRAILIIRAEIPSRDHDHRLVVKPRAAQGEMQQPRTDDASAVDDDADDLALGRGDAAIDGMRRRGRGRIDADETKIPR
jgi:hypothetical protein